MLEFSLPASRSAVEDTVLIPMNATWFLSALCDHEVHSSVGLPREPPFSSVERFSFPVLRCLSRICRPGAPLRNTVV